MLVLDSAFLLALVRTVVKTLWFQLVLKCSAWVQLDVGSERVWTEVWF